MRTSSKPESPPDPQVVSRRSFLALGIAAIGGFIGAALGIPLAGYAVSPALQQRKQEWSAVGPISDFSVGQPKKVEYSAFKKDGWIEETVTKPAWVIARENGEITVFDPRCTHLGCAYRWDDGRKLFLCPCHDAVFDIDGKVVSGPPPRPLDRLEARVQDGKLMVMGG
ncbi:MAG: ubiquinol-cytochrome c reductase iron-sulfur subunit [Chloroflexi bacterium]|nr:ubiquinol-cytochrome c reductase iron-sulfur subunit [Chloroflexota bacterium]